MQSLVEQLKVPVLTVLIAILSFFVLTKILGPIPFSVNSIQTTKSDLFTVNGVGEVDATPESATVTLGVTQDGQTAEAAQNAATTITNRLITELQALGIEKGDIKTQNITVNPTYDFQSGGQTITGYTASQNLEVNATEIDLANKVIDTATAAGANVISGLSFDIEDEERERLTAEARKLAINDAKEKAKTIASEAGISLGKVVNIQVEEGNNQPMAYEARTANDSMQKVEPTNLQPGESTVRVTVYLSYETL